MSVLNSVPIHPLSVEIFHRISENFNLMVLLQKKSGDQGLLRMNPLGTMIACTSCNLLMVHEIFECEPKRWTNRPTAANTAKKETPDYKHYV